MPNHTFSLLAVLIWAGCVTADPRQATDTALADAAAPGDTSEDGDTSPVSDAASDSDDTVPGPDAAADISESETTDIPGDGDTSPETDATRCQSDDACPAPADGNPCAKPSCIDGQCALLPVTGGTCDDRDRCTRDDYCDGLTCTGIALDCMSLDTRCWTRFSDAACNPDSGCDGTPMPADSPCDDLEGPTPGTCAAGLITPPDACDGLGFCQTPTAPSTNLSSLSGDWYLVISALPAANEPRTLRAVASLQPDGRIALSGLVSQDPSWQADAASDSPRYCIGADDTIRIESANRNYDGSVSARSRLMVLAERGGDQGLALALENSGTANQVNGTYRVAMTTTGPAGESLITARGRINFTQGRISGGSGYEPQDGLGVARLIKLDSSPRIEVTGSLAVLEFRTTGAGVEEDDIRWTGAIGPRGDVLLFTREDDGLHLGTILLVRDIGPPPADALAGRWFFAAHRGGASLPTGPGTPRLDAGRLDHGAGHQLSGRLDDATSTPLSGWWLLGDADSRVSYRIIAGAEDHTYGGWFAGDVVMAWRVAAPDRLDLPTLLDDRPIEGSLFVSISPLDFDALITEPAR